MPASRSSRWPTARTRPRPSTPTRRCMSCTRCASCTTGCRALPEAPPALPPRARCEPAERPHRAPPLFSHVLHFREPARAFVLRFDGQVVAYLNRCVHVPTEMDWQPGEFLDGGREFIICAIHGASYAAQTGRCIGGPCGQGRLLPIETFERDDAVWWQPTRDTLPAFPD